MISPGQFGHQLAHKPWTSSECARLRFMRWAIAQRRLSEGESEPQWVGFRRDRHVFLADDEPRLWDIAAVLDHERVTAGRPAARGPV